MADERCTLPAQVSQPFKWVHGRTTTLSCGRKCNGWGGREGTESEVVKWRAEGCRAKMEAGGHRGGVGDEQWETALPLACMGSCDSTHQVQHNRPAPTHLAQVVQLDLELIPYQLLHVLHARIPPIHPPGAAVVLRVNLAADLRGGGQGQGKRTWAGGGSTCKTLGDRRMCSAGKPWVLLLPLLLASGSATLLQPPQLLTTWGCMGSPLLSVICTQPALEPRRTKEDTSSARPSRLVLPARPTQMAQTREDLPVPAAGCGRGQGGGCWPIGGVRCSRHAGVAFPAGGC